MEKPRHNTTLFAATLLFFLATSAYAVSPKVVKTASAKGRTSQTRRSPGVLLQKGIYAEETEGDLDKAIEIYQQVIEQAEKNERIAAQATYQLGICHLKKGNKSTAGGYFQKVVRDYAGQDALVLKAQKQLSKIEPEKVVSLFEEISPEVISHLIEQYSKLVTKANSTKLPQNTQLFDLNGEVLKRAPLNLPCNGHVYYVDKDFNVYSGGLSHYLNRDSRSQTGRVKLGITSYPDQTLYDTQGNKLNTDIVVNKNQKGIYDIYWIPDEPFGPGGALFYGWSKNSTSKLSSIGAKDKGLLVMQNQYGPKVLETFFLVLPAELYISDYDGTGGWEVDDYSIFPWTQEVERNANHLVNVVIKKRPPLSEEVATWIKELHNPDAPRFVALNKLIKIGEPAVLPLIAEMEKSNDWQVPKALGAIKDKRAIGPLIDKWKKADFSPMKEVINEALEILTGEKSSKPDVENWNLWWLADGQYFTPEDTIKNFMAAAIALDVDNAMRFVAPDSHDYEDIKKIFEMPEHPFNEMFQKIDPDVPIEIVEAERLGKMCTAVWRMTFKEDFTIKGKTFKKGETFDLDGGLRKYDNRWLITGI